LVTLWAVKFSEAKRFYKDIMQLPVAEENPDFIMFETKPTMLAFHKLARGPRLERSTVELRLRVRDVDEVYRSLRRKGVKFASGPFNYAWGTRMASFLDPEGYTVEIVGPLKMDQTATEA